jgi:hypothetical protein
VTSIAITVVALAVLAAVIYAIVNVFLGPPDRAEP